nr:MAG TPA: hypothetical protein [Caudoviricetes sp.]DAZ25423.1 MAG TPA: hypothetical protein [Caudoviricetes sp.]
MFLFLNYQIVTLFLEKNNRFISLACSKIDANQAN